MIKFAYSIMAQKIDNEHWRCGYHTRISTHTVGVASASNYNEALGMTVSRCLEEFKKEDGYQQHSSVIVIIPEGDEAETNENQKPPR